MFAQRLRSKSHLAIEFAYRHLETTSQPLVIWIDARNETQLVRSCQMITGDLGFPCTSASPEQLLWCIRDWLNQSCSLSWVMVVDDFNDPSLVVKRHAYMVSDFETLMPQTSKGTVIVTTRNRYLANEVADDDGPIELRALPFEDVRLLLSNTNINASQERDTAAQKGLRRLADACQDQQLYREAEAILQKLLEFHRVNLGEHDPETLKAEADLAIARGKQGEKQACTEILSRVTDEMIATLGVDNSITLRTTCHLGSSFFHRQRYREADACFRNTLESQERVLGTRSPDAIITRRNLATSLRVQHRYDEAEQILRQCLRWNPNTQPTPDTETLSSLHDLCDIYLDRKDYSIAEVIIRQVLTAQIKAPFATIYSIRSSMQTLGVVLEKQGRFGEAESVYLDLVKDQSSSNSDPETLSALWNLGLLCRSHQRFADAAEYFSRLVDLQQRVVQNSNDKIDGKKAETFCQLAWVYSQLERYDLAERYNREAMELHQKQDKEEQDRLQFLRTLNNLAAALQNQDKFKEAAKYMRQVASGRIRILGYDDPLSQKSMENLGVLLYSYDNDEEDLELNYKFFLETPSLRPGTWESSDPAMSPDCREGGEPRITAEDQQTRL
ncbi:hypothetical protein MMC09_005746 [Bachmanniomyces sp. S44760]|nr:hypothetical protein [Bachmanniomyces sp. S44760]